MVRSICISTSKLLDIKASTDRDTWRSRTAYKHAMHTASSSITLHDLVFPVTPRFVLGARIKVVNLTQTDFVDHEAARVRTIFNARSYSTACMQLRHERTASGRTPRRSWDRVQRNALQK